MLSALWIWCRQESAHWYAPPLHGRAMTKKCLCSTKTSMCVRTVIRTYAWTRATPSIPACRPIRFVCMQSWPCVYTCAHMPGYKTMCLRVCAHEIVGACTCLDASHSVRVHAWICVSFCTHIPGCTCRAGLRTVSNGCMRACAGRKDCVHKEGSKR